METLYRLSYWGKRRMRIHSLSGGALIGSHPPRPRSSPPGSEQVRRMVSRVVRRCDSRLARDHDRTPPPTTDLRLGCRRDRATVRRPAGPGRAPAPASARRLRRHPAYRRRSRGDRRRRRLQLGPLLPALRRSRRQALRVLDHARRLGRGDRARRVRRPRHLQQLPQPRPARRHGPHGRQHQRRPAHPRDRLGLVREGLRRVRLRVRHRRWPARRARRGAAADRAAARRGSTPHPSATSRS